MRMHVGKEMKGMLQETRVIDRASRVKVALHIHLTPEDQHFNP